MSDKKNPASVAPAAEPAPATATAKPKAQVVQTDNNNNGYLAARRLARKAGVTQ